MNQLPGIISEILSEGQLSIVKITITGGVFSAIVIDTPSTASYLEKGALVNMLFKENEVVVAKDFSGQISLQNRFDCAIVGMEMGKLLCKVIMNYQGFEIRSLITANAALQMDLAIGDKVTAMVKTNEISLLPHD